jgi:hypothetical protein
MNKLLYRSSEARAAIGCGITKFYDLVNNGTLDARRFGKRTYITAQSIEVFIASLKPVVTPTMVRAERKKWLQPRRPRPNPQEDEPAAGE